MPVTPPLPDDSGLPSFEQIHKEYHGRIYTIIFRMVHDANEGEDLTLETFLAANRRWKDFDRTQRISTWLHGIAFGVLKARFQARDMHDITRPDAPK